MTRMQQRGMTEAEVLASDEVPLEREIIVAKDTGAFWIGNGVDVPADLPKQGPITVDEVTGLATLPSGELVPTVDAETQQLPDVVRAVLAANLADPSTVEGAAAASIAGQPGPQGKPGPQGLPGVNAVENDTAVAGYISTTGTSATKTALFAGFQRILTSDGTSNDQSARINAALSAGSAFGLKREVRLVGDFTVTSPCIIQSDTTLDLTNAVLRTPTGTQINAIRNGAYADTARSVTDGLITAGSTTLKSPSAAFTAADIGQPITIQAAGANGAPLVTSIASVASSTAVELVTAAAVTPPYARLYVAIGARDKNITIRGGYIDRNATYAADTNDRHAVVLRRVDGLTIENTTVKVTNGKYAWSLGDVTDVHARNLHFDNTSSDGFHVNGPARQVVVEDCTGITHDDFVAFLVGEGPVTAQYWDTQGDIDQVYVRNITGASTTCMVKLSGDGNLGKGHGTVVVDGVSVDTTVTGYNARAAHLTSGSGQNGAFKSVTLRNLYGFVTVFGGTVAGGLVEQLVIEGLTTPQNGSSVAGVNLANSAVVKSLRIRDAYSRQTGSQNSLLRLDNTANVVTCAIESCDWGGGSSSCLVQLASATSVMGTLSIADCVIENTSNTGSLVGTTAGCTLTRLFITNTEARAAANVVSFNCSTEVFVNGLRSVSTGFNVNAGYTMTIRGAGLNIGGANGGAGTIVPYSLEFRASVQLLVSAMLGAMFYNTQASAGIPTGPVLGDGSTWVPLAAAMARGTATLGGGTATVPNTNITAASLIRLTTISPSGTVGTPYVAARSAGTGFTIGSTSATDNSQVFWEVVKF